MTTPKKYRVAHYGMTEKDKGVKILLDTVPSYLFFIKTLDQQSN